MAHRCRHDASDGNYNSGRHLLSTDDARGSLALALYALAAGRSLRRHCTRVELHHLPTGTVIGWDHTDATLDLHLRRAHDIAAQAAAAEADGTSQAFPARPGPMCGWCEFVGHCAEGRTAATPYASWAGLAPDITPLEE